MKKLTKALSAALIASTLAFTMVSQSHAELQGRYLTQNTSNGFDAYYDTLRNVTWLADASYGGTMSWDFADNWVQSVRLGGYDDWRLPTYADPQGNLGEFYQLWVHELGNNADQQHPILQYNPGPFHNVIYYMTGSNGNWGTAAYWTDYSFGDFAMAWMTFNAGWIGQYKEGTSYGVWLCRTGDSGWSPPPCTADFNGDSIVDFFDYLDFVDAFSGSMTSSDFNADGVIDFFDYLDFVDAFSAGC